PRCSQSLRGNCTGIEAGPMVCGHGLDIPGTESSDWAVDGGDEEGYRLSPPPTRRLPASFVLPNPVNWPACLRMLDSSTSLSRSFLPNGLTSRPSCTTPP